MVKPGFSVNLVMHQISQKKCASSSSTWIFRENGDAMAIANCANDFHGSLITSVSCPFTTRYLERSVNPDADRRRSWPALRVQCERHAVKWPIRCISQMPAVSDLGKRCLTVAVWSID